MSRDDKWDWKEGDLTPLGRVKVCEACGDKYGSEEEPKHPSLCPYHASVIDRETKEREEEPPFSWFE